MDSHQHHHHAEVFDAAQPVNWVEFLNRLFVSDFMPHGHCYYWRPDVLWMNVISDAVIAFSYFAIPIALVYFVKKRKDMPFHWIFFMFGAFIILCGCTHLMDIWTIWHGTYRFEGVIKVFTAIASIATAIVLIPLLPIALALPSKAALNKDLEAKAKELEKANQELKRFNDLNIGREERIIELKKEVNALCREIGKDPLYSDEN